MRSPGFADVIRLLRLAAKAGPTKQSSAGLVAASSDDRRAHFNRRKSRREFIAESSRLAALAAGAAVVGPARALAASRSTLSVGIVGAGLAGLACADALRRKGVVATVYEASNRVGGRCYSLRNFFPGQVAERGGEFIDNPHKTLLGYAREFNLTLEDVTKEPGEVFYFFNGQHYQESEVVDAFREFVPVMQDDLRQLSAEVTALDFTPADRAIDQISLEAYLAGSNSARTPASALVRAVIAEAYAAEYGLEAGEQNVLNFLMFIHSGLAIDTLGYGTNSKMMVEFDGRPWLDRGSNGTAYVELPNVQTTWETNPVAASGSRGVLTDYSSGDRGARLQANRVQTEALNFLTDLDLVFPGAFSAATQIKNRFVAHLEPWPSNPLTKGSYTCYRPGQFTTIAGYEGVSAGPLHFAGEHANSFYVWQGFMEGAAISGIDAAKAVLALV